MTRARILLVTVPDHETALRLSRMLVGEKLAACVNVVPGITSVYRWQGRVEEDGEELLIVKTTEDRISGALEAVSRDHPYDVPEGLVLTVERGLEAYLEWVQESVRTEGGGRDL
jgi:periplasmic divalent cation tolerance protein